VRTSDPGGAGVEEEGAVMVFLTLDERAVSTQA